MLIRRFTNVLYDLEIFYIKWIQKEDVNLELQVRLCFVSENCAIDYFDFDRISLLFWFLNFNYFNSRGMDVKTDKFSWEKPVVVFFSSIVSLWVCLPQ